MKVSLFNSHSSYYTYTYSDLCRHVRVRLRKFGKKTQFGSSFPERSDTKSIISVFSKRIVLRLDNRTKNKKKLLEIGEKNNKSLTDGRLITTNDKSNTYGPNVIRVKGSRKKKKINHRIICHRIIYYMAFKTLSCKAFE